MKQMNNFFQVIENSKARVSGMVSGSPGHSVKTSDTGINHIASAREPAQPGLVFHPRQSVSPGPTSHKQFLLTGQKQ